MGVNASQVGRRAPVSMLRLADNKVAEGSTWDEALVAAELASLGADLAAMTGFSDKEIEKLLGRRRHGQLAGDGRQRRRP